MSGVHDQVDTAATLDEWLALSDAERAEVQRRIAECGPDWTDAVRWTEESEAQDWPPEPDVAECEPVPLPTLSDVLQSAESLDLNDRIRLIGRLWQSLPLKNRAATVTLGLECLQHSANEALRQSTKNVSRPIWPIVRRFFFDPAKTSELYSAPRQFDLATIFVAMAAYSILFGTLAALDFGPVAILAMGLVTSVVAVSQASWHGSANPRGVSVIAGAATFMLFSLALFFVSPHTFDRSFFVAFLNGLFFGPILGYMAGVLVGGVFLAADALRGKLKRGEQATADEGTEDADG